MNKCSQSVCFSIDNLVSPQTQAGLELTDVPVNGEYKQNRKVVCVFRGTGVVKEINHCVIDFDLWDTEEDIKYDIGKLNYTSYLIECDDGRGWAGEGAIKPAKTELTRRAK